VWDAGTFATAGKTLSAQDFDAPGKLSSAFSAMEAASTGQLAFADIAYDKNTFLKFGDDPAVKEIISQLTWCPQCTHEQSEQLKRKANRNYDRVPKALGGFCSKTRAAEAEVVLKKGRGLRG
jgi:hypothetical protein